MPKKPDFMALPHRIAVCKEYAALWQRFFAYFSDTLADKQITEQMEADFAQIASLLALNQYKFEELVGEFMPDARKVLDVLNEAQSLQHIQSLNDAQFSKIQVDWHTLFISMNKALGKLSSKLTPKMVQQMQAEAAAAEGQG